MGSRREPWVPSCWSCRCLLATLVGALNQNAVLCKSSNHCFAFGLFRFSFYFFYKVCPFFIIVVSCGPPYHSLEELELFTTTPGLDTKLFRVLVCVSKCRSVPVSALCHILLDTQSICVIGWSHHSPLSALQCLCPSVGRQ